MYIDFILSYFLISGMVFLSLIFIYFFKSAFYNLFHANGEFLTGIMITITILPVIILTELAMGYFVYIGLLDGKLFSVGG